MAEETTGAPSGALTVEVHHCDSAQNLLEELRPGLPVWNDGGWIFRGQGDDWPLLPAAHRFKEWKKYLGTFDMLTKSPRTDVTGGAILDGGAEEQLIRNFHQVIENAGLPVPQHNPLFDALDGQFRRGRLWEPELLPLVALAQHHGIPTRLLDWSRRPRVAAYFAARQALKLKNTSGSMVVWALRTDVIGRGIGRARGAALEVVTAPRASNPNLHAQEGVFTLIHQGEQLLTVNEFLEAWYEAAPPIRLPDGAVRSPSKAFPAMHKFVLSRQAARRVLTRVAAEGVSAAVLFPGYYGAAEELRERAIRRQRLTLGREKNEGRDGDT